mgnify:CR=1 FL=1
MIAAVLFEEGALSGKRSLQRTERELAGRETLKADAAPAAMPRKHGLGGPWVTVRAQ